MIPVNPKENHGIEGRSHEHYFLYSFELKLEINFSNLRKCYFQAVSNSSWANYGYLVVENINLFDIDLMNECYRLTEEFRIGLIKIDINNYFNSKSYLLLK